MTEISDASISSQPSGNGRTAQVIELPGIISAAGLGQALRQVDSRRVILVMPLGDTSTRDLARSNMTLWQVVRRQADAQGLNVALVTRDARIRQLAGDAGLPVFGSVQGAQSHEWRRPRAVLDYEPPQPPRNPRQPAGEARRGRMASRFRLVKVARGDARPLPMVLETLLLIGVLLLSAMAVSGLLAFIVPAATVHLVPAQEPLSARVTITARPDVEGVDSANNIIPARRIGQRVEGDGTIQATGSRSAPDAPASGVVVFTNRQSTEQQIPAGTTVATSTGINMRFQTLQPATLPGGVGAQVTIGVEAMEPGPAGNVRAGAINTVEGPLSLSLNVLNPGSMGGGGVKQVPVVTQGDKNRLRAQVLQQVTQQAYVALGELLDEGEFVPPETVGTLAVAETYDRFTDEEASQVSLRLRLLATALAVDGVAGDELALRALGDKIPRRGQLLADSIIYNRGGATVIEGGETPEIVFDATASGVAVVDIDPAAVRAAIRGLPRDEALEALRSNWRLQTEPELSLGPEWLLPILRRLDFDWLPIPVADRVPWLPFRTKVIVDLVGTQ